MPTLFIGGSRHITTRMYATTWLRVQRAKDEGCSIITGDASGVDLITQKACLHYEIPFVVYGIAPKPRHYVECDFATYRRTGNSYSERDKILCDICDEAWLCWDGSSSGTKANIARLRMLEKKYEVWQEGE